MLHWLPDVMANANACQTTTLLQQNAVLKQQNLKKLQRTSDSDRTSPSREWVGRRRTLKAKHSRVVDRHGHWRNFELTRHRRIWRYRCSRPRGGANECTQRAGSWSNAQHRSMRRIGLKEAEKFSRVLLYRITS